MKKVKFNYKYLLISLSAATVISATAIGLSTSLLNPTQSTSATINQNLQAISTDKIGQQVGNIRHWQNNSFNGIEVKNGGFAVLTGTQSATRIDAFGNILWEFDPQSLSSLSSEYQDFNNKKVVEIVQDEGSNANVLYLLLIPKDAPDELKDTDPTDASYYSSMTGTGTSAVSKQATIVQITENINSYSGSTWTPSFVINKHINIDPKKMVDNYPTQWKTNSSRDISTTGMPSFAREDHPSWYVSNAGQQVDNTVDNNSSLNETMVLPWKQYITNLGNMYAKDGIVLMFGGNGSIYNDPEALSIGMWKLDFTLESNNCTGIPYAYLLRYLQYDPGTISNADSAPNRRWNQSYAPIGQTDNFSYVPRLTIGGVQTNASGNEQTYIYLAGGITVGQVPNSQTRHSSNSSNIVNAKTTSTTIQDKRSLQLTGKNILSSPQDTEANSIDPALLFGIPLNIDSLLNLPMSNLNSNNINYFQTVLYIDSYFDIGATMSVSSAVGTYYYFDNKDYRASASSVPTGAELYTSLIAGDNYKGRLQFPWDGSPNLKAGEVVSANTNETNSTSTALHSYSYNMSLLIENAINYYYPTLTYGYSLKSLGSLTKVKTSSKQDVNKDVYGYAMQVGKSIVYLNEPKPDVQSLAYHGPSTVSIGDENLTGKAYYNDIEYMYAKNSTSSTSTVNDNISFTPSGYTSITNNLLLTGVAMYVEGIKDFNDTIPTITKHFKISENPYDTSSSSSKPDATLPWNKFVGLNSTNFGTDLSSLWLSNENNDNEHFIITSQPSISEYYGNRIWNENLYYNFSSSGTLTGPNKAWFEVKGNDKLVTHASKGTVSWQVGFSDQLSLNTYYLDSKNNSQVNGEFDVLLETRDDAEKTSDVIYGQIHTSQPNGISYRYLENDFGVNKYQTVQTIDRNNMLGEGEFVSSLSNDILTNNISNILDKISLSLITGKESDSATEVRIVKSQFASQIFKITKQPTIYGTAPQQGSVLILASNINFISQSATFTAYSWNSLTKTYDIMPRTGASNLSGVNNSVFAGFSAMADWILPVVIAIPIVLVALIIGLGCAIGIPMAKHKKSIKVGFEMQHQKVNTLTTAVGGVFKKIIDNTSADSMKAKPQMLKAGSPAPAKPAAAPGPKPASGPAPKPSAPSAAPANTPKPAAPGPKPASSPAAPK